MAGERLPLGIPDVSERLMRALDIKGDVPQEVAAVYQAVMVGEDLTQHEYFWLRRGRSWAVAVSVGPVAAQNAVIELQAATVQPDTLAIIDQILITNDDAAARTIRFGLGNKQLAAVAQTPIATDDRAIGQTSAFKAFAGNLVYAVNNQPAHVVGANTTVVFKPAAPWILTGGADGNTCFAIFMDVLNLALRAAICFRERQIIRAER